MRLAAIVLAGLLALGACNLTGEATEPTAPEGTPEFVRQQEAICEAQGGNFTNRPGDAAKVCITRPKDANQQCSGKSDCEGQCLARSQTCAPVVPLFGCNDVLLDGGQRATVCLN